MTGYTRADTPNNIADGNIINAADLDGEYDAIAVAFSATVGHTHDGSAAEGQPITKIGPAQDIVVTVATFLPKTTATVDIGSSALKFKDFYFSGAGSVTGTITAGGFSGPINGTVGATTASTGAFTTLSASSTTTLSGLTASTALALDASKNIVSVTNTGTGNNVLATSPTLVTPVLGTPTSVTLTNATGLPVSTGISGLGTGVATFLATPSSANLASAVTDETGTGALVFATSPTLITPALGTPSALVGTNITGTAAGLTAGNVTTNANLTGAVTSTGNATLLGSFSSANLAAALTDETGSGSAVFATSPTLVTPALGTPSSVTLTNATGLPISTGVSGLGTGIATALAVSVGTAGSPVVNGGVLGTPSSGTLTNATGLPISTGVSGLGANVATFLATPSSTNLAAAVTDETGSGALVFATSPTLVTPALGTPSSATLTNATGLPIATGVSGLGTNVAAFLATPSSANLAAAITDETGTGSLVFATSPTFVTPALGTPASGVVTNLTGTASININGTVGATTPAAATVTTLTATADSSFTSTGALTISKGTTAERPTATSGMFRFNTTTTEFEGYNGTAWASVGGAALSNDTTTATNVFPLFATATSGSASSLFTSNAKFLYKPSTGELQASEVTASNGLLLNATTVTASYTIGTGFNAMSVGPVTVASGQSVTVSSGQRWLVF